jgi:hypothetical protein
MEQYEQLQQVRQSTVVAYIDGAENRVLGNPSGEKTVDNRRKSRLRLKLYDA